MKVSCGKLKRHIAFKLHIVIAIVGNGLLWVIYYVTWTGVPLAIVGPSALASVSLHSLAGGIFGILFGRKRIRAFTPQEIMVLMANKGEATKQKIFLVSLRLFARRGYGNTTIRDIAQAADVSMGLLFHYFPSKQALLAAHLDLAADGMESVMELLASDRSPLEVFSEIAELVLAGLHQPAPRWLYLLMSQPLPTEVLSPALQEKISKDRLLAKSITPIKKGQQLVEIRLGDPEALAVAFWGAIQGIAQIFVEQPNTQLPESNWLVDVLRA